MHTLRQIHNKVSTRQLLRVCVFTLKSSTHSNQQAAPVTVHISIYSTSNIDELTTVLLHSGDDMKVRRMFYASVPSLMIGQWGSKHVAVNVFKHYCNFTEMCVHLLVYNRTSSLRIWWPNIISNKDLWKVTGQEDINLEIRKRKSRRIGHALRKEDGEIPKAASLWNHQRSRKRGRPRNSWRRSVIKETGRSWNELRFLAADRKKWKGLIDNLCS